MSRAPRRTAGLFAAGSSNIDLIILPSYQAGKLMRCADIASGRQQPGPPGDPSTRVGRRDALAGDRFPLRRHVARRPPDAPGAPRGGPRLGAKGRDTAALPDRPRPAWSSRGPAPGPLATGSQAPG